MANWQLILFQTVFICILSHYQYRKGRHDGLKKGIEIGIPIGRAAEREGLGDIEVDKITEERHISMKAERKGKNEEHN